MLVTKYLAYFITQALGLGKLGNRVHRIKTMCIHTMAGPKGKMSSALGVTCKAHGNPSLQIIWSDKLGFQNIRRATSR